MKSSWKTAWEPLKPSFLQIFFEELDYWSNFDVLN